MLRGPERRVLGKVAVAEFLYVVEGLRFPSVLQDYGG